MSQTTTVRGRAKIVAPDKRFDAIGDGGAALDAAITAIWVKVGDNLGLKWTGSTTLANAASISVVHNFGQVSGAVTLRFHNSDGTQMTAAQVAIRFTIVYTDANTITLTNISGGSLTFFCTILPYSLALLNADIEAAAGITATKIGNGDVSNTSLSLLAGLTAPLVTTTGTQTLTGKTLTSPTINSPVISGGTIENASVGATTASTGRFTSLAVTGSTATVNSLPILTTGNSQDVDNKNFFDSTNSFKNTSDASKVVKFSIASIATATTRTWTFPDASDTFVGINAAQSLNNKTLGAGNTISGCTASEFANLGTIVLPTGNVTLATRTGTETFTNKTLTSPAVNSPALGGAVTGTAANDAATGANQALTLPATPIVRLTAAGTLTSIGTIPAGVTGQLLILSNATGTTITMRNEYASGTAANRVLTGTGSDLLFKNNSSLWLFYDGTSSRWKVIGGAGGGGTTNNGTLGGGAGFQITLTTDARQYWGIAVTSGGALSSTPFSSAPADMTEIILRGTASANFATILHNDANGGCILNGDCTLGLGSTLSLIYDASAQRYFETARNSIGGI